MCEKTLANKLAYADSLLFWQKKVFVFQGELWNPQSQVCQDEQHVCTVYGWKEMQRVRQLRD